MQCLHGQATAFAIVAFTPPHPNNTSSSVEWLENGAYMLINLNDLNDYVETSIILGAENEDFLPWLSESSPTGHPTAGGVLYIRCMNVVGGIIVDHQSRRKPDLRGNSRLTNHHAVLRNSSHPLEDLYCETQSPTCMFSMEL